MLKKGAKNNGATQRILDALKTGDLDAEQLAEATGIGLPTVTSTLSCMFDNGRVGRQAKVPGKRGTGFIWTLPVTAYAYPVKPNRIGMKRP